MLFLDEKSDELGDNKRRMCIVYLNGGVISQTFVIHTIRTPKLPFIQDNASKQLYLSTSLVVLVTLLIGFTAISGLFDLPIMVPAYAGWMVLLMLAYMVLASVMLRFYKEDDTPEKKRA